MKFMVIESYMKNLFLILVLNISSSTMLNAKTIVDTSIYYPSIKQTCTIKAIERNGFTVEVSCPDGYGRCEARSFEGDYECSTNGHYSQENGMKSAIAYLVTARHTLKKLKLFNDGAREFSLENYKRASELFEDACNLDYEEACQNKDIAFNNYKLILKKKAFKEFELTNFKRAYELFSESCGYGDDKSCENKDISLSNYKIKLEN